MPSNDEVEDMDVMEPVAFVGYPNALFDSKNHTPIIRRGTLATPFQLDYDGRPVFLIDASVFPGSSGSPVFLYREKRDIKGNLQISFRLLGIIAEVFFQSAIGKIEKAPAPTSIEYIVRTKQMIGLGVVFKSRTIIETIEDFRQKHENRSDDAASGARR